MKHLPPRTTPTSADMPLSELVRPLSAKALPRRAMTSKQGHEMTEDEAQARANLIHNNRRNGRRKGTFA